MTKMFSPSPLPFFLSFFHFCRRADCYLQSAPPPSTFLGGGKPTSLLLRLLSLSLSCEIQSRILALASLSFPSSSARGGRPSEGDRTLLHSSCASLFPPGLATNTRTHPPKLNHSLSTCSLPPSHSQTIFRYELSCHPREGTRS
ncbi:hypothetical protein IE53DRAFT_128586 [Violaceomyces palustris]|uniref:Uncharacterized protein n=1 Tax=Violaceomyces palustris TaxID=1673888 RepID=A0ACD0NVH0_9BASI|nr:hypothetical protein IE53DRAFT_128586 [Violaceomyces palustris]